MAAPLRRTEAKAFFANERTFLHWMNMSVTVGSISAALIGVAGHAHKHWSEEYEARSIFVRSVALVLLTASIGMAVYATYNFRLRTLMLQYKQDGPYDNRLLPVLLAVVIMTALSITFVGTIISLTGS